MVNPSFLIPSRSSCRKIRVQGVRGRITKHPPKFRVIRHHSRAGSHMQECNERGAKLNPRARGLSYRRSAWLYFLQGREGACHVLLQSREGGVAPPLNCIAASMSGLRLAPKTRTPQ